MSTVDRGQEGQQALSLAGPQTGAAAHGESAPPQPTRMTGVRSVETGEGSGREGSDTIRKLAKVKGGSGELSSPLQLLQRPGHQGRRSCPDLDRREEDCEHSQCREWCGL